MGGTYRLAMALAAILIFAACGNVQEALLEEAIEQAGGNEFELNLEDDGYTVQTEEGEISGGGGADLPDGFDFNLPDGYEVVSSFKQGQGNTSIYYVQVSYPAAEYDRIVDDINRRNWPADLTTTETGGTYRSHSWASPGADQAVTLNLVDDLVLMSVNVGLN